MVEPLAGQTLPSPMFPETPSTLVADAVVRLFQGDAALSAYCREIDGHELEELYLEGTVTPPALIVLLDGLEQRRSGSGRQADRFTLIRYGLVREPSEIVRSADRWLTHRVLEHTLRLIYQAGAAEGAPAGGVLLDPAGRQLTIGVQVAQRVPRPVRLPGPGNFLMTRVDAVFLSKVHEATGDLYDDPQQ